MVVVEVRQQTLAWMVVIEVRQGTLVVDGRGEDEEEEEDEEGRKEGRQATNIKSNNPHLAGGEKRTTLTIAKETVTRHLANDCQARFLPLKLPS